MNDQQVTTPATAEDLREAADAIRAAIASLGEWDGADHKGLALRLEESARRMESPSEELEKLLDAHDEPHEGTITWALRHEAARQRIRSLFAQRAPAREEPKDYQELREELAIEIAKKLHPAAPSSRVSGVTREDVNRLRGFSTEAPTDNGRIYFRDLASRLSASLNEPAPQKETIDAVLNQLEDAMHLHLDHPATGDWMSLTRAWREILEAASLSGDTKEEGK